MSEGDSEKKAICGERRRSGEMPIAHCLDVKKRSRKNKKRLKTLN